MSAAPGHIVYYHQDGSWWWKLLVNEEVTAHSERGWLTRRGAMDDWNHVKNVMDRLANGGTTTGV